MIIKREDDRYFIFDFFFFLFSFGGPKPFVLDNAQNNRHYLNLASGG